MPESRLAAVDNAAPVMAHWTICSWEALSEVRATAAPVIAPATALFFCRVPKNMFSERAALTLPNVNTTTLSCTIYAKLSFYTELLSEAFVEKKSL